MDVPSERTERLLALSLIELMRSTSKGQKVAKLNVAGFSNIEIAELLSISPAMAATLIYQSKKVSKKKAKKSSRAKKKSTR